MYIYIFKDGEIRKRTTFSDDDADACDSGILKVIDISGDEPRIYSFGSWYEIKSGDE